MPHLIAILWLALPVYLLVQALFGLWRRWWLLHTPVRIEAQVIEVKASHVVRLEDATVVELIVRYGDDGKDFEHTLTRTDHQRAHYTVGSTIDLIHEDGNPANAIDASRSPWDDVIGPLVFAILLLLFMAWAGQFLTGLTRLTGWL